MQDIQLTYDLPNVTSNNNTFTFKIASVFDGMIMHTLNATITTGVYYNAEHLAIELDKQINLAIDLALGVGYPNVSVDAFSYPGVDTIRFTQAVGDKFALNSASPFFAVPYPLKALDLTTNFYFTPDTLHPIWKIYQYPLDDYIDILSDAFYKDTKMPSTANTHSKHNIICRINDVSYGTHHIILPQPLNWTNILYDRPVYSIDFRFLDVNGKSLNIATEESFRWLMTLMYEN